MMGLKAANNGILAAMSRQGAKDWMSVKSMQAEHHKKTREVNKWSQPRSSDSEEQRLTDRL
jgi:hypothetical protein